MTDGGNYKFLGIKLGNGKVIGIDQLETINPHLAEFAETADRTGSAKESMDGYATIDEMKEQIKHEADAMAKAAADSVTCYNTEIEAGRVVFAKRTCGTPLKQGIKSLERSITAYKDFTQFLRWGTKKGDMGDTPNLVEI